MRAYSHSQLRLFDECPLAWRFSKIDKVAEEPSRALIVGGATHSALESYVRHCHEQRLPSDAGEIGPIVDRLTLDRGKPCPEDVRQEVAELLERFAKSYAVKLKHPSIEGKVAFDAKWQPVEWFAKTARFRGIMDLLDVDGGVVRITDWKTGYRIPPAEEVKTDPQLLRYAFLASLLFPDVCTVEMSLYHVRFGVEQGPYQYDREDLEPVGGDLERRMQAIDEEEEFAPTPGDHCERCSFRRHCPVYRDSGRGEIPEKTDDLVSHYFALKARLKDVEAAVKARIEAEGPVPCGGGKVLGYVPQERTTIEDVQGAIDDLLGEGVRKADLYRAITLSKTKLESLLKKADAKDRIPEILAERGEVTVRSVLKAHKANGGS